VLLAEGLRICAEEQSQHGVSSGGEQLADHVRQQAGLGLRDAPAQRGDAVVGPALIAGRGALVQFDQPALEQRRRCQSR